MADDSLRVLADHLAVEDETFAVAVKALPIDALIRNEPANASTDEDFLQAMEARLQGLSDVVSCCDERSIRMSTQADYIPALSAAVQGWR